MIFSDRAIGGVGLLAALMLAASAAQAADPGGLVNLLFPPARPGENLPMVARYTSEGGERFVFGQVNGRDGLIKYENSPEIWALSAVSGPRGDVIYKNDVGQPVLRATRLGGLTLFTSSSPGGVAAAPAGAASVPRPPPVIGPEALWELQVEASARASRAVRHLIFFDAIDAAVTPASESVFADAFTLTADAISDVADRGRIGATTAAKVFKVRFVQGKRADALAAGPVIQITVAPQMGVAGRPSSRRIAAAILRR